MSNNRMNMERYMSNPNLCPTCSSPDISRTDMDGDAHEVWMTWTCEKCHALWMEEYKLVYAEMLDDNGYRKYENE